jgi:hypothetical protein
MYPDGQVEMVIAGEPERPNVLTAVGITSESKNATLVFSRSITTKLFLFWKVRLSIDVI